MCAGILFCDDNIQNKTLALYDAMQDSFNLEIAGSDDDIVDVITYLIYLACYHLPELYKKNGGEMKDSDFEYPEYEKEHFNLAKDMVVEHWVNIIFGPESKIEREQFYMNVKNATCSKIACSLNNTNAGCGDSATKIFSPEGLRCQFQRAIKATEDEAAALIIENNAI